MLISNRVLRDAQTTEEGKENLAFIKGQEENLKVECLSLIDSGVVSFVCFWNGEPLFKIAELIGADKLRAEAKIMNKQPDLENFKPADEDIKKAVLEVIQKARNSIDKMVLL